MASTQSSADLRKAIEVAARSFLAAYTDAYDHNDPSLINRDVTADCTRHMLPSTMVKALGLPAEISIPNEAYIQNITQNIRVYSVRDSVISDLVIDTEARKASFTSKSNIVYKEGWESHPIEFSWYLDFTEDGSKVKKVTEFCDKDTVLLLHGRVMAGQPKYEGGS